MYITVIKCTILHNEERTVNWRSAYAGHKQTREAVCLKQKLGWEEKDDFNHYNYYHCSQQNPLLIKRLLDFVGRQTFVGRQKINFMHPTLHPHHTHAHKVIKIIGKRTTSQEMDHNLLKHN